MQRQDYSQATSTLGNTPNLNIGFLHQKETPKTQANERSSEQNIQSKKTCKYVVASSYELFKTCMFLKISDNSTIN